MKKLAIISLLFIIACKSQKQAAETIITNELDEVTVTVPASDYRASVTKSFDLIHTKLDISFDWDKHYLMGEATITMKPHFYPATTIYLDARGMEIKRVASINNKDTLNLNYSYGNDTITINLGKELTREEKITVYINYIAKPDELSKVGGSDAISSDKGLYFINADGKEKDKPKQIWTQGETQSNSVWFPTIDVPNQKTTQELNITVANNFKTLSNGLLVKSIPLANNMRTDCWKMDLPHAPYLFMMAIGEFAIVKDKWRDREVNYYVEPKYEIDARAIFGNTPEMMEFFSKKMGVDYAWPKYSQVVVRDYVSGAMENTSATIHGEFVQQTAREMIDRNNEDIVSHELFHHWFGDLATCESWSNLPLNESFATYGEYLWNEYKYGRDIADIGLESDLKSYLDESKMKQEHLIRFYYENREDMFDRHSYAKGGTILHMLRKHLGDDAFFAGLQLYLKNNSFKSAEVHDLRLAFEEVTGEDLNWFFNQWFLNQGHPTLSIKYNWDAATMTQQITVEQLQDLNTTPLYKLPVNVDFYFAGTKNTERIVITEKTQTFSFRFPSKPLVVNFDSEKMLTCSKTDEHSEEEWIALFNNAPLYLDKKEALEHLNTLTWNENIATVFTKAINDKNKKIRSFALSNIDPLLATADSSSIGEELIKIANDTKINSAVRVNAISKLSALSLNGKVYATLNALCNDSSYNVIAASIEGISSNDMKEALKKVNPFENSTDENIVKIAANFYSKHGDARAAEFMLKSISGDVSYGSLNTVNTYLKNQEDFSTIKLFTKRFIEIGNGTKDKYIRMFCIQGLYSAKSKLDGLFDNSTVEKERISRELESINQAGNQLIENETNEDLKFYYKTYFKFSK
ncbi:MAG: M1 family aminopeptidase [Bacteroidota bacterium]